jgi:hypothetical protein
MASAQSLRLTMRPWLKVRALGWRLVDDGPALLGSFARFAVTTAIRLIIFSVPTAYVAQWCDVPSTWKSMAFMTFCIIWSACVFDRSSRSAKADDPSAASNQKAAAVVMTSAEVAAAARRLSREQKSKPD